MNSSGQPVRQFVSFSFYRLDPAFRRLEPATRRAARTEFLEAMSPPANLICRSYGLTGLRGDCDFLLWRISADADALQSHAAAVNKTALGGWLSLPHFFLSMTKRSMYIDKLDPGHSESRAVIIPGKAKYLFVYPFVKTREWYQLGQEERQQIMDEHIRVGNKYPSVKLNTTYSFGLDDQDFVVAFETDEPKDFLDLVMDLRHTAASRYTQRDTPILSCAANSLDKILDMLF